MEKARDFQKNIYFCFIDYTKAFMWITINCGKFLKRWEYQTTFSVFRNVYAGQKATVRTGHGTKDWFKTEKEDIKAVCCYYLFKFYAEYLM